MCFCIVSFMLEEEISESSQRKIWPPVLCPCSSMIEKKECDEEESASIERFKATLSHVFQYGRTKEEETLDLAIFKKLVPDVEEAVMQWTHAPDVGCVLFFWGDYQRLESDFEHIDARLMVGVSSIQNNL